MAQSVRQDVAVVLQEATRRRIPVLQQTAKQAAEGTKDMSHAFIAGCEYFREAKLQAMCVVDLGKLASAKLMSLEVVPAATKALMRLVEGAGTDDELQLRIIQAVNAFVALCESECRWMEEPLSAVITLFLVSRFAPACAATIMQASQALLQVMATTAEDAAVLGQQSPRSRVLTGRMRPRVWSQTKVAASLRPGDLASQTVVTRHPHCVPGHA